MGRKKGRGGGKRHVSTKECLENGISKQSGSCVMKRSGRGLASQVEGWHFTPEVLKQRHELI